MQSLAEPGRCPCTQTITASQPPNFRCLPIAFLLVIRSAASTFQDCLHPCTRSHSCVSRARECVEAKGRQSPQCDDRADCSASGLENSHHFVIPKALLNVLSMMAEQGGRLIRRVSQMYGRATQVPPCRQRRATIQKSQKHNPVGYRRQLQTFWPSPQGLFRLSSQEFRCSGNKGPQAGGISRGT
jgi:hypothetical protein